MTLSPLPYQPVPQPDRDTNHLKTLAILHYVWGGISIFFGCFGLIYITFGLFMVTAGAKALATSGGGGAPPAAFGWIFVVIGAGVVLAGWTIGGLNLYSARCMQKRKHRTFSLVMAGLNCTSIPLGTTLGVFTFIVLLRPSVEEMYSLGAGHR